MLKRIIIIFLILLLLLLTGGSLWFFFFRNKKQQGTAEDTVLVEELAGSRLPYIRAEMFGEKTNAMRPYRRDPGMEESYDTLTILPADRRLVLYVEGGRLGIHSIRYEIRSADKEELIENTEYTDFTPGSQDPRLVLPIQNLLQKEKEYRLKLTLSGEEGEELYYFTRIMLTDEPLIEEMFSLAYSFSKRNFNYNAARDNTTYLESDETGDNSTLGLVNLKSNFNQLTYRQLGILPRGERDVRISAFDGNMGEVIVRTLAARTTEEGIEELFEIRESFVMRMGAERLYMLDYTRHMAEVFSPGKSRFTGSRVLLGISEESRVFALEGPEGGATAFVSNRDLFYFDPRENVLLPVFSMRDKNEGILGEPDKNDIKILGFKMAEDAETPAFLDFLHYGYMHRGPREGETGISYFRYDLVNERVRELSFFPVSMDFMSLQRGMDTLAFSGENGFLYFKLGDMVYSLVPESGQIHVLADRLLQDTYAISRSQSFLAWQSKPDEGGAKSIYFMNFRNGRQQNIAASEKMLLKPEGFVDDDLVLGALEEGRSWFMYERRRRAPYSYIEILDAGLQPQNTYRQPDRFLDEVEIEESRIHLNLYSPGSEDTYVFDGEDTIISNAAFETPAS